MVSAFVTAAGLAVAVAAMYLLPESSAPHMPVGTRPDPLPNDRFPDVTFVDVTASAGIDFRHTNGAAGESRQIERNVPIDAVTRITKRIAAHPAR